MSSNDDEEARDQVRRESVIQARSFDVRVVDDVASCLGVSASVAPFRLPSGAVYQLLVPDKDGRPAVMLTLWPSIHRVDAISTAATVVFTDVQTVDLVGEIEVQFRRGNRDYLIIARGGKVIVRA